MRGMWRRFWQAVADQKKTDYPGCCRGIMNCRSTVCGCLNESKPNFEFVWARMEWLKNQEEPQGDK